jgi:hypothetical protein
MVTFTVLQNGSPVGSSVIGTVSGNQAKATYDLLAGTAGGSYTIQAVYSDPSDFQTSTGTNTLIVSAASTTITPSNASANFNTVTGEGMTLSANVTSPAGPINQGAVTFNILNSSSTAIVPPIVVKVVNGLASENYVLPAGTSVGTYTITSVYDGTASFAGSLPATSTLTITGATTSTVALSTSIGYDSATQSVPLSATITSPGGTVSPGTLTFTIFNGSNPVGSPVMTTVSSGTASASYPLRAATAIGSYTILAVYSGTTDFGGSSDNTHVLTVTQPPAYQLTIGTQPSSAATAGQAFSVQPVIDEDDQYGNLETGDNSTIITATISSGAGTLLGTATATVLGGVATFTGLADDTAGTITLKFQSGNLQPVTSDNIVISPAAASQLAVTQQPSATATAGAAFATQPIVEEEDQYGNVITTDSTHTVTVARGSVGSASLEGTPLTVTLSSGVATFAGLSYDKAETMNLGFTTTASGVSSTSSNEIVVSPTTASQLVINQQPSATATVGQPISPGPVIYLEDQYNNLETGDNSTVVTAMLNSGVGPLAGTATTTVTGGVARFSNLIDNTAETISLAFTSGVLTSLASGSIVVSPGAPTKLVIRTQPSSTATAGQKFAVQPVIAIEDADGNVETTDNTTEINVALSSGNGLPEGTTSVTVKDGVATFAGLNEITAGTIALEFTGDGLSVGPSTNIVVSPAAPFRLAIKTQPSSTATAGQPFPTQPVIEELDQFGNIESTDSSTVITASLSLGNGPLVGTSTATLFGGVATFTNLADTSIGTISLGFAGGGLSVGPTNNIVISAGPAAALSIATQPYPSVVAGSPLTDPIVIDEVDQYGNIVTSDNTTVVTASLSSGAGTLIGTETAKVLAGVASFNDLEDNTAGKLTLQFTAASLPAVISNPSVVAPAAASVIKVVGPPSGVQAGVSFQVVATAYDAYNNVATSFDSPVTVSLASGYSGTLSGATTVTAANGTATFSLTDTASGPADLSVASSSVTGDSTGAFPVSSSVAAKLVIQTQPSQTANAGSPFAAQPVIWEEDQYGNLETGDSTTVITAYLGSGAGTLKGTLTATVSGGIATFTGLADDTAGTITLDFAGGGLTSLASAPVVVSPAAASTLVIETEPSSTATVHQPFATQPVIEELDKYGNIETDDSSTLITAALATGAGPLQGTTSVRVADGIATFTGLGDNTPETISLKFSGGGLTTPTSSSIIISPAAAYKLVIQTQPAQAATAGQAFATHPAVWEEDQYGDLETGDNSTVVTAFLGSGTGPLGGTLGATVVGGIATFSTLTDNTAETITLKFTGGGLTSDASLPTIVSPAAASRLVIQTEPSSTATAGAAFSTQPVVEEEDQYGNLEVGDSTTLITALLASGAGPLKGTVTATLASGIATFSNLSDNTAETITLDFSGGGHTSAATAPIVVSPAAASALVVHTQPSPTAVVHQPFATQPVIDEVDKYGNLETGDDTTVITAALATGAGPLLGTQSVTLNGGVATFADLSDNTVETIALEFSGGGLSTGPSASILVSPAPASKLVIETEPSPTATAGEPFAIQPVIAEVDSYGDVETGDSSTIITVSLASGTGPLQGTTTVTLTNGVAKFSGLADDRAETFALKFAGGGLPSTVSTSIAESPGPAADLVVISQPPGTVKSGQGFGLVVAVEDKYGNVESSYSGPITVALANNPGGSSLGGTTTASAVNGSATFAGLTLNNAGNGYTIRASGNGLVSATTTPFTIAVNQTSNSAPPTIISEQVIKVKLKNSKGKPTGKTALEFLFKYSTAMNPNYAGLATNYLVETAVAKGGKKKTLKYSMVGNVTDDYNAASNVATLTITGKQPFTSGGKISINATGPNGVQSANGVLLDPSATDFMIGAKAKTITPS